MSVDAGPLRDTRAKPPYILINAWSSRFMQYIAEFVLLENRKDGKMPHHREAGRLQLQWANSTIQLANRDGPKLPYSAAVSTALIPVRPSSLHPGVTTIAGR